MSIGDSETFEVEVKRLDGITIIRPMGEIDLSHSPTLRIHLREAYKSKPSRLIIDLGAVPYMDSSGVAILVEAMKNTNTNGGKLILCDLQVKVRSIFEIARLDTVFVIAKNPDDAMMK
ncbi:MAG TPA: STAS domain-containing protein [Phycisphaerales bacterium]|nr:STAS domain-containing protein [Phycisphaerales bacterium]